MWEHAAQHTRVGSVAASGSCAPPSSTTQGWEAGWGPTEFIAQTHSGLTPLLLLPQHVRVTLDVDRID